MWIALNDSFFSIVASGRDPDVLNVRARRAGDIERYFPGHDVHAWAGRDYAFRAFIPRDVVAAAVGQALRGIGYTNFKASVADDDLYDAYLRVWADLRALQDKPRTAVR